MSFRTTNVLLLASMLLGTIAPLYAPYAVASAFEACFDVSDRRPRRKKFGSSLKDFKKEPAEEVSASRSAETVPNTSPSSEQPYALKLQTLLVVFDILVTDPASLQSVPDLRKEDLIAVEDGRQQEISVFTRGHDPRLPRSIILIIDYSGSQSSYLETSVAAAKTLVSRLGPSDEMAIVTDDVELLADYTSDKDKLARALDSILARARKKKESGDSLQFTALFAALRELVDHQRPRSIIVFQTDGDEAPSLPDQSEADRFAFLYKKRKPRTYGLDDIYQEVRRSRATIYSVIPNERLLGVPADKLYQRGRQILEEQVRHWAGRRQQNGRRVAPPALSDYQVRLYTDVFLHGQIAVNRVAELGGGWAAFLDRPDQAAEIYFAILSDINDRYVIGYYPTNAEWDGQLRNVRIEVRGHPEYKVHGRTSYYAPGVR